MSSGAPAASASGAVASAVIPSHSQLGARDSMIRAVLLPHLLVAGLTNLVAHYARCESLVMIGGRQHIAAFATTGQAESTTTPGTVSARFNSKVSYEAALSEASTALLAIANPLDSDGSAFDNGRLAPSLPKAVTGAGVAILAGRFLVVVGGRNFAGSALRTVYYRALYPPPSVAITT